MQSMDLLIFVHKNWLFDPWISCLKPVNVAFACEAKFVLMVELEVKFENQANNEDSFKLHNSF
jgi:hypothetical protein